MFCDSLIWVSFGDRNRLLLIKIGLWFILNEIFMILLLCKRFFVIFVFCVI